MRNTILAFASLVALGSVAHADDSIADGIDVANPDHAAHTYVSTGGNVGFVDQYVALGGQLEIGRQLASSPLSLHAAFATGAADELLATGNGQFQQVRAGADLRGCVGDAGVLCAFVGTDVGYQHTRWVGDEGSWFSDEGGNDGMTVTKDASRMIGVGRVGLDIGGKHFRWRPGIEAVLDGTGVNNGEITQSIAYRW